MSLELWNTVFAGLTFAVIAATAIAALVQLRHLRSANQLNAMLTLLQMWDKSEMQDHIKYVRTALQPKLSDPAFLDIYRKGGISRSEHPELLVADYFEQIGTFLKYGLIDEQAYLDAAAPQAIRTWDDLEPAINAMREARGPASFENLEYAAVRALMWQKRYPAGNYPQGLPRMKDIRRRATPQDPLSAAQPDSTIDEAAR